MDKTKKLILLFSIVICFSGMLYSADFGKGQSESEEESEECEGCEECVISEECELFYIRKEDTNECIETLKASSVYESDPYGRKVESMMIIPGI